MSSLNRRLPRTPTMPIIPRDPELNTAFSNLLAELDESVPLDFDWLPTTVLLTTEFAAYLADFGINVPVLELIAFFGSAFEKTEGAAEQFRAISFDLAGVVIAHLMSIQTTSEGDRPQFIGRLSNVDLRDIALDFERHEESAIPAIGLTYSLMERLKLHGADIPFDDLFEPIADFMAKTGASAEFVEILGCRAALLVADACRREQEPRAI